jgi:hypothetical protein
LTTFSQSTSPVWPQIFVISSPQNGSGKIYFIRCPSIWRGEIGDKTEPARWKDKTALRFKGEFALTAIDNDLFSMPLAFVELTAAALLSSCNGWGMAAAAGMGK